MKQILITLIAAVIITSLLIWLLKLLETGAEQQKVFASKEECESRTQNTCVYQMCDYVPPEKTISEICGENFKKGWVLASEQNSSTSIDTSSWKAYNNEEYGFELFYPVGLEKIDNQQSTSSFYAESKNGIYSMQINVISNNNSLEDYLSEIESLRAAAYEGERSITVQKKSNIKIDKHEAIQQEVYLEAAALSEIETFVKSSPSIIIEISLRNNQDAEIDNGFRELNEKILSTMRFNE